MGTDRFPTETSYTSFHRLLDVGRVNRVVYRANETSIRYYIDDTEEVFGCNLPYDPVLFKKLVAERPGNGGIIQIEMEKYPRWLEIVSFVFNAATPMVLVFYAWLIYEGTYKDSSEDMFGNMTTRNYDSNVRQGMTLKDITGIDNVKAEMFELISYLKDFDKYNSMGARIPAGVLLCGPPGTGKTLLARCVAGEANVPFFSCAGTEFMEMFVGVGAARIRNLFDQAKKVAPCIIFIDEFDAVGTKRTETQSGQVYGNDEATATINQMLTEMDGFSTATGIMVLAATNRPQVLDPALIRAGRFDRIIEMGLPNKKVASRNLVLALQQAIVRVECRSQLGLRVPRQTNCRFQRRRHREPHQVGRHALCARREGALRLRVTSCIASTIFADRKRSFATEVAAEVWLAIECSKIPSLRNSSRTNETRW